MNFIKNIFCKSKPILGSEAYTNALIELHLNARKYYGKKDLHYFKNLNAYACFDYNSVKDVLLKNDIFGVSIVHLALNDIYFSNKEEVHSFNKKTAINYLSFLRPESHYVKDAYPTKLFQFLWCQLNNNTTYNLVFNLINPFVFINALKEFQLIEIFPALDIDNEQFEHTNALQLIDKLMQDNEHLEILIKDYLDAGKFLPNFILKLTDQFKSEGAHTNQRLAKYLKSMVYTAIESTAGFISFLLFSILREPEIMQADLIANEKHFLCYADEILRIYTPVPFIYRTVQKDCNYANYNLKKGDLVVVFLGAGNTDPKTFDNPLEIQLNRTSEILSFGKGRISCIGKNYAVYLAKSMLHWIKDDIPHIKMVNQVPNSSIHNSMLKLNNFVISMHD